MRKIAAIALLAGLWLPASAFADAVAVAAMKSENEVPSVISDATAKFTATIQANQIKYRLQFKGLTGDTLFAHIHVGQFFANGGVAVFLCNNTTVGPVPQPCPQSAGTITGTITAADVIGPAGQGVSAGEFADLLRAIGDGVSYVNIHTTPFGNGEVRGQIIQIGATPTVPMP